MGTVSNSNIHVDLCCIELIMKHINALVSLHHPLHIYNAEIQTKKPANMLETRTTTKNERFKKPPYHIYD